MHYDYPLYRPPSEADSLIVQITLGCSSNTCLFCGMYKTKQFVVKDISTIEKELEFFSKHYPDAQRVFLADGDAFVLSFEKLRDILLLIHRFFPHIRRISAYGNPTSILSKTSDQLQELAKLGFKIVYIGLESGSQTILNRIQKKTSVKETIDAVTYLQNNGIYASVTVVLGLGEKQYSEEHALQTAQAISLMNPRYCSALTLMPDPNAPLFSKIRNGSFYVLSPMEILQELKILISHIEGNKIIFRSNHASNYLALAGTLSQDKALLLQQIEEAINYSRIRPDWMRGL